MEDQNTEKQFDEGATTPSQLSPMPAPQPAYVPPPPMQNYATLPPQTNAWAIVSLISSILSWIGLFGLGGIVAVITGIVARNQIKENPATQTGDGLALAGIILGGVNVVVTCIGILCFAAITLIPILTLSSN
ncbi:MAG: DUF4190 domain-containing protein [Candidatus Roseilinea sp.]|uniref:DUF4190 domain-containing protein n=1 Tax=Candidatus Roseilinea sp. TaxID=2838777 RepID=UPI0040496F0C